MEVVLGVSFVGMLLVGIAWVLFFNPLSIEFQVFGPAVWLSVGMAAFAALITWSLWSNRQKAFLRVDLNEGTIFRNGTPVASVSSVDRVLVVAYRLSESQSRFRVALDVPYRKNFVVADEQDIADAERLAHALAEFMGKKTSIETR